MIINKEIRMSESVKAELQSILKFYGVKTISDLNFDKIAERHVLSEDFMRTFQNSFNWFKLSQNQTFSEDFFREFSHRFSMYCVTANLKVSEDLIREFYKELDWTSICSNQYISEALMDDFTNEIDWDALCMSQQLSKKTVSKFKKYIKVSLLAEYQNFTFKFLSSLNKKISKKTYDSVHKKKTYKQKLEEVKAYARQYGLRYDKNYLYAYRNHDKFGRGYWKKSIRYEKGKYYRDWHCDIRQYKQDSFGLGIWPYGNVEVKVKIEDWGTKVFGSTNGKARVWGFEII